MKIPVTKLHNDPIVVVCSADDNYAMPLAITIRSVLENLAPDRRMLLFIIDVGIESSNRNRILKSLKSDRCEIQWIPKPTVFNNVADLNQYGFQNLSIATWYRLVIPELLSAELTKAIYLDCDLVIKADLGKLWDVDIADNYLLAVTGKYVPCVSHPRGLLNWEELGFDRADKYFGAGVLVFNLEKWRSANMCTKAVEYALNNQQYIRWTDNDVLVAMLRNQWGELDPRWNCPEPRTLTAKEIEDAFILHFTSAAKPWIAIEQYPATDLFFNYLEMTDWSGYKHTVPQRLWRRLKREVKNFQKQSLSN